MGFETLLGSDELKSRLSAEAAAGRLSHCCLIAGPAGSGKHTLARLLAAAAECTGEGPPCGVCRACRKVLAGVHPDVIVVDAPEKKQLPVDLIRSARADLFIQPNEGRRKVLIFPRAQDMNAAGQNALLKILEEPPDYGMFLLLSDAPEKLLPTIRSRAAELRLAPLSAQVLRRELSRRYPGRGPGPIDAAVARSGGWLGQAMALLEAEPLPQTAQFARVWAAGDELELLRLFCSMEKLKRERLIPVLEELRALAADALLARSGRPVSSDEARCIAGAKTAQALLAASDVLQTALRDCRANISTANICAGLFAQLSRNENAARAAGMENPNG